MTLDKGPEPYVVNIEDLTIANDNFRTAAWSGQYLQMTLMSIPVGGEVGAEIHGTTDQFLRLEQGNAKVVMGPANGEWTFEETAADDFAIFVPAGTWHNVINVGDEPLKIYSIYAPAHHPFGTVHETKAAADAAEQGH